MKRFIKIIYIIYIIIYLKLMLENFKIFFNLKEKLTVIIKYQRLSKNGEINGKNWEKKKI